ncbi:pentatricopeptide repeat-containing protein At3g06920-like [Abrus precatorius]|uniref:Pentatricopeptide repeat-containing protein At3g06920-like n=1 Tax=Abrus precatorius TaxID=3816 RepID=A0A8B8LS57_ABRPR|nr:pentatricopeptide repeat-containing protein At3g06920-like [Abrus precatorius]
MGIRKLCNILRFFSTPNSAFLFSHFFHNTPLPHMPSSFLFSIGGSSLFSPKHPFASSSTFHSYIDVGHSCFMFGSHVHVPRYVCTYTNTPYWGSPHVASEQVSQIIALIREDVDDLGAKLNTMNVSLSEASVINIFQKLSSERVSALRFFDWLKCSNPKLCCDPDIGSLFVNNCGLLGNYEATVPILCEFNLNGVFLGMKAFGFLLDFDLDKASTMECVRKVMDVFNEVGGVYQSCGVPLLIEMFGVSGSFEIAEFVIRIAGRKVKHYHVLMRIMCKKGDCERVGDLVKEMKRSGCDVNGSTYNLLLSCLCKNGKIDEACHVFETMEKDSVLLDVHTFDIVINFLCKRHQFDLVLKLLEKMNLKGIEPRILTHAAVIKSYFESGRYEEAHKYVIGSAGKLSYSSNANYSLLATLHLKNGNVLFAHKVLSEMMDKGLKPNFSVYMKVRKCLEKGYGKDLSLELLRRYSSLIE